MPAYIIKFIRVGGQVEFSVSAVTGGVERERGEKPGGRNPGRGKGSHSWSRRAGRSSRIMDCNRVWEI